MCTAAIYQKAGKCVAFSLLRFSWCFLLSLFSFCKTQMVAHKSQHDCNSKNENFAAKNVRMCTAGSWPRLPRRSGLLAFAFSWSFLLSFFSSSVKTKWELINSSTIVILKTKKIVAKKAQMCTAAASRKFERVRWARTLLERPGCHKSIRRSWEQGFVLPGV